MTTSQNIDVLSKQLQEYSNPEFHSCISDNRKLMSANDKSVLKIFEKPAEMHDGHHVVEIPWKSPQSCHPNNKCGVESRQDMEPEDALASRVADSEKSKNDEGDFDDKEDNEGEHDENEEPNEISEDKKD